MPRTTLLFALLAALGLAAPAQALPFFFDGAGGVGFDPTNPGVSGEPQLAVDPGATWLGAGAAASSPDLLVTAALAGAPTVPVDPSFLDPILATVEYTVTNTTGLVLAGAYLVFTFGATAGWPEVEPDELGLDEVASPGPGGTLVLLDAAPYVFGAVLLPTLGPGDVHGFELVHVVADDLAPSTVIPTPGQALLVSLAAPPSGVPEPAAPLLLACAAAALRARRRR